jgi:hypothetical protein
MEILPRHLQKDTHNIGRHKVVDNLTKFGNNAEAKKLQISGQKRKANENLNKVMTEVGMENLNPSPKSKAIKAGSGQSASSTGIQ